MYGRGAFSLINTGTFKIAEAMIAAALLGLQLDL